MKFYLGLVISILIHLLLLGLLSRTYLIQPVRESVFEVDIVAPSEVEKDLPKEAVILPLIAEEPLREVIAPDPAESKTIYVEGAEEGETSIDPDTAPYLPDAADETEADASPAEESDKASDEAVEEKALPPGENVFALAIESSLYVKESVDQRRSAVPEDKKSIVFGSSDILDWMFSGMFIDKIRNIEERIEKRVGNSISGELVIGLVINKDGSLVDVDIVKPSGHILLDEATVKNIKDVDVWPFPRGYADDRFPIIWHYIYKNRGRYYINTSDGE